MHRRRIGKVVSILLCMSLVLGGCGKSGAETTSEDVVEEDVSEEPEILIDDSAEVDEASSADADSDSDIASDKEVSPEVEKILASMTLEEKVSQMIIPSIRRWDADNEVNEEDMVDGVLVEDKRGEAVTELNEDTRKLISDFSFGGVILFADNFVDTEQTVKLINDINEANAEGGNKTELFICADEEGGNVARLTSGTAFCGNMALGATQDTANAQKVSQLIAEELSVVGINVNFAPVSDVNNNPGNPVIGVRSFSDDPEVVSDFAQSYIKGIHSENIMTAAKHFPGHGNTEVDSHTGLPMINLTEEELEKVEFIPFEGCIEEGTDFIMTAHIQYPQIEKEQYKSIEDGSEIYLPATLSKNIITGILREKMGYDGLVVTDSLVMDAIYKNFDPLDSARYAINAGEDVLLMPLYLSTPDSIDAMRDYIDGIVKMVEDGEIEESRIDEAVTRILETKLKYGLLDGEPATDDSLDESVAKAQEVVGSKSNHDTEWEITEKAVTMVKNDNSVIPLDATKKSLLVCPNESHLLSLEYAATRLKDEGVIDSAAEIDVECYAGMTEEDAKKMAEGYDNFVLVSELFNAAGLNPTSEGGETAAFIDALIDSVHESGGKFVLISSRLPYDAARYQKADAILIAYGDRGMTELPAAEGGSSIYGPDIPVATYIAFGGSAPSGKLPIEIPKVKDDYTYSDEILYERGFGMELGE